ncbi:preprotein translocase secY subunit [Cutibacterium acnes JCM 18918]|nr:preprotein translocase secY subunit [Cutibacterium acnes JCM 18918]
MGEGPDAFRLRQCVPNTGSSPQDPVHVVHPGGVPARVCHPRSERQCDEHQHLCHPGELRFLRRSVFDDQLVFRWRLAEVGDLRFGYHALHHCVDHPAAADGRDSEAGNPQEGGASGQNKITQYTRYLTLVLGLLQATAFVTLATSGRLFTCSLPVVYSTSVFEVVVMILTMTAGTTIVMWMGELITDRGIGNGMSIMIFTQIAARFPDSLWSIKVARNGAGQAHAWFIFSMVIAIGLAVMAAVVFIEQGQRRIPVQYAKRMVGRRMFGGSTTYIPLKVNQSGVIPVIFASSILYLPVLYATFRPQTSAAKWIGHYFTRGDHPVYNIAYFLLIIFFCYFYVAITFDPVEMSDNMKKYGGFIPGIRPGSPPRTTWPMCCRG